MLELVSGLALRLPESDARHGFGLFETIRVEGGRMPFLSFHLERLARGSAWLGLGGLPDEGRLLEFVAALPGFAGAGILRLYALDGFLIAAPARSAPPIAAGPWDAAAGRSIRRMGSNPTCAFKTLSNLENRLLAREASERGLLDAVALNESGRLSDGSRTNLFVALRGEGRLVTPPTTEGALPGVSRRILLEAGLAVESTLDPASHGEWEGAMLANSVRLGMPLSSFDGGALDDRHPLVSSACSLLEDRLKGP